MVDTVLALTGLRQMQRRNRELLDAVSDGGDLSERILRATVGELLDVIEPRMPVLTGAGLAAQRGEVGDGFGRVFTDPTVRNPINQKARPNDYLRYVFAAMGLSPYDAAVGIVDFGAIAARETDDYLRSF